MAQNKTWDEWVELSKSVVFIYIDEAIMPENNEFYITKEHAISIIERIYGVTHIGKMHQKYHEEFSATGLVAVVDNTSLGLCVKNALNDPEKGVYSLTHGAYFQMNFNPVITETATLDEILDGLADPNMLAELLLAPPAFQIQPKHIEATTKLRRMITNE